MNDDLTAAALLSVGKNLRQLTEGRGAVNHGSHVHLTGFDQLQGPGEGVRIDKGGLQSNLLFEVGVLLKQQILLVELLVLIRFRKLSIHCHSL